MTHCEQYNNKEIGAVTRASIEICTANESTVEHPHDSYRAIERQIEVE